MLDELERRFATGDAMGVVNVVRTMTELSSARGEQWVRVVQIASAVGDDDGAFFAARRLYEETPDDPRTGLLIAQTLDRIGRSEEAIEYLRYAMLRPDRPLELMLQGARVLMHLGAFEEAEFELRDALRCEPLHPFAWEMLSMFRRFDSDDPDIEHMREAYRAITERGANAEGAAALCFALAKVAVDMGSDEDAGSWLDRGAEHMRAFAPSNIEAVERSAAGAIECFDVQLFRAWAGSGLPDARMILICGAPRSGSSLVEQVLGAHPDVRVGGEHRLFRLSALPLGDGARQSVVRYLQGEERRRPGQDPWARIGRRYAQFVEARVGAGVVSTDKQLSNLWWAGAIRLALPDAKIVVCERDPIETAWSIWKTRFGSGMTWSYDPDHIARYVVACRKLQTHWREVVDENLVTVRHGEFVEDAEVSIPRLLLELGLSDDPKTRRPHASANPVRTASVASVRQPITKPTFRASERFPRATAALVRALQRVDAIG